MNDIMFKFKMSLVDMTGIELSMEFKNLITICKENMNYPLSMVLDECLRLCEHEISCRWYEEHKEEIDFQIKRQLAYSKLIAVKGVVITAPFLFSAVKRTLYAIIGTASSRFSR